MEEKSSFKPFIPAEKIVPEFTATSIVIGVILAVLFGGANAYLGLRVGMTVSASIPAAVISMGIIRVILHRESILENNMVQTIGSAGESVAAGAIFTLPAMFMWMKEWGQGAPSLIEIALIALCGGILGVLFMVPLRSALIVKEHGVLPYPEGTACAEVLLAGEEGGAKAGTVFAGLGIAALYKFIADGLKIFPSEVHYEVTAYKGSGIGMDILPALAGVGYICGPRISSYMLAGGVTSWFVLMPLIALFGIDTVLFPGSVPISEMDSFSIWTNYIKYIGAGAVAAGGIMSLIKSLPLIVRTFAQAMSSYRNKNESSGLRTDQDMNMGIILILIVLTIVFIWLFPPIPVTLIGAVCIALFGFFFATVSSRLVGLVGSSNNPVSGMAIATLLISTILLKSTGSSGQSGMMGAIAIGSVICIIAAIAGDTSQDLKTGYIVGATPRKQQYGELVGVVASAIAIGGVLYLLDSAWGYGSQMLPAPQAMLMKMVVEGVMEGNLPWTLVFVGVGIGIAIEILGIPVLPFAVGLYLPIHLSTPIMVGGLIRLWFDKRKFKSEKARKAAIDSGVLYMSGMIAGEGLVGILLAVFAVIPVKKLLDGTSVSLGDVIDVSDRLSIGQIGGLIVFALLLLTVLKFTIWRKSDEK
ncbi:MULTISPECIES: OPT family oligopeptide transporter [Anaerotruncus]|uniref:Oligopeptide transporter, OPT family n=1 Tax=Anaerotruncus colihominis TaxID=169435 RepID=A0A845RGB3_9FIRM|nr:MULTISPECIES: oligopeptide transporter, OPT family [Anaerotruncus]MCI8493591.1 oligopeptide transporter, OPT family [Anaerotruncus sp.]MCR2024746.1 oligopeptide transporter, OPT family [Anaerotruncus colihominis]NBI78417.1 oligopeptide transporter, OPT family [Anaerotruncus colihominis]NDO38192.1 oligopeptide transporter, OPT family [Anaerotruncus colihominis]